MTVLSEFEEMYLKRLFEVHNDQPDAIVKTSMLAELMGVSAASTTEMIQRLAKRDLVTHIPYKGSRLTTEGFTVAASIKRRQLLLENLLSDIICFEGDIVAAACRMEHTIDGELEAAIDRMLGYPERTARGERIPVIKRRVQPFGADLLLPLANLPSGAQGRIEIIALEGTDSKTLQGLGLVVGATVTCLEGVIHVAGDRMDLSESILRRILIRAEVGSDE